MPRRPGQRRYSLGHRGKDSATAISVIGLTHRGAAGSVSLIAGRWWLRPAMPARRHRRPLTCAVSRGGAVCQRDGSVTHTARNTGPSIDKRTRSQPAPRPTGRGRGRQPNASVHLDEASSSAASITSPPVPGSANVADEAGRPCWRPEWPAEKVATARASQRTETYTVRYAIPQILGDVDR